MSDREIIHHFCRQIIEAVKLQRLENNRIAPSYISPYHFQNLQSSKHIDVADVSLYMEEMEELEKKDGLHCFGTFLIK